MPDGFSGPGGFGGFGGFGGPGFGPDPSAAFAATVMGATAYMGAVNSYTGGSLMAGLSPSQTITPDEFTTHDGGGNRKWKSSGIAYKVPKLPDDYLP